MRKYRSRTATEWLSSIGLSLLAVSLVCFMIGWSFLPFVLIGVLAWEVYEGSRRS